MKCEVATATNYGNWRGLLWVVVKISSCSDDKNQGDQPWPGLGDLDLWPGCNLPIARCSMIGSNIQHVLVSIDPCSRSCVVEYMSQPHMPKIDPCIHSNSWHPYPPMHGSFWATIFFHFECGFQSLKPMLVPRPHVRVPFWAHWKLCICHNC